MQAPATLEEVLDGSRLSAALSAGIARVLSREELLNRINVFPVPDGDTGTNLALTLLAVHASLQDGPAEHAGALMTRAADAALDGARGNSGAILAQFLLGVADRTGPEPSLTVPSFAAALGDGAAYARESMAEPREGTILSVLTDFAAAAAAAAEAGAASFTALFERALPVARRSLEATREQLESLRRANVVDAGGLGLVELLEGMAAYLQTGVVPAIDTSRRDDEAGPAAGSAGDLEHRWCTECMVTGEQIDRRRLREEASALGSSLVVAGTRRKVRLHLHLNEPERLFELAARHGEVSGQKADDMQRQQGAAHHERRRRVAVVTDSAADLPDSVLEQFDIHMVPVRVHFGAHSYLDKISLSPAQFFERLATDPVHPKTSQPPPGDFRRAYEFLGSHYDAVVYVGLTARVSGTFQNGESAAARARSAARILAIDSQTASLGQGLVVMRAAEVAAAGGSADEVREAAAAARRQTRTWACLVTLDYAVRGGRIPAWAGSLARWLRLTPLLAVRADGGVGFGGVLPGRRDPYRRFGRLLRRRVDPRRRWRVGVAHANEPDGAQQVLDELTRDLADCERLPVIPLGTALGAHGGPGCIVVAVQELGPAAAG